MIFSLATTIDLSGYSIHQLERLHDATIPLTIATSKTNETIY